jgi:hypothetical protein
MNLTAKVWICSWAIVLTLVSGAFAQGGQSVGFLWDGNQWTQLSLDAKVGYIKGVGNLADFENAANKGKSVCISRAFAEELKTKTINQVIAEVDKFYQDNPTKLSTTVLEVIVMRCTTFCPPGAGGTKK